MRDRSRIARQPPQDLEERVDILGSDSFGYRVTRPPDASAAFEVFRGATSQFDANTAGPVDANYRLGNHFMSKDNPQQALRHYQAAMRNAPADPRLKYSAQKAKRWDVRAARVLVAQSSDNRP